MRLFGIFILVFLLNLMQAQSISGVVKDSSSGVSLPFVNMALMKSLNGCSSQVDGSFLLSINKNKDLEDTLVISAIGFKKKHIPIKSLLDGQALVLLTPNSYDLTEVVIKPSNKKWKKKYYKLMMPHKSKDFTKSLKIGYQEAIYIENTTNKIGKIESVIVELEKFDVFEKRPYVDFRIRVYEFDKVNNCPGNDLLKESVVSSARGGTCYLDVSKYNIIFPMDGVVVGMEYLDTENKAKGADVNVMPQISYCKTVKPMKAWYSFFNRYWIDGSKSVVLNQGFYYPVLGIKMSMEEEKK